MPIDDQTDSRRLSAPLVVFFGPGDRQRPYRNRRYRRHSCMELIRAVVAKTIGEISTPSILKVDARHSVDDPQARRTRWQRFDDGRMTAVTSRTSILIILFYAGAIQERGAVTAVARRYFFTKMIRRGGARSSCATSAHQKFVNALSCARCLTKARKMPATVAMMVAFSRVFRQPIAHCQQIFGVGERGSGNSLPYPPRSMPTRRAAPPFHSASLIRLDPIGASSRPSGESSGAVRCAMRQADCGRARSWSAGEAAALIDKSRRSQFLACAKRWLQPAVLLGLVLIGSGCGLTQAPVLDPKGPITWPSATSCSRRSA